MAPPFLTSELHRREWLASRSFRFNLGEGIPVSIGEGAE
jgi:hypothetical protein